MAEAPLIQSNFTKGEVTSKLRVRGDSKIYFESLGKLENFHIMTYGGVVRSPGTRYVATVKDQTRKVRLIPFKFDVKQNYVLEFGHQYIRFYRDGGQIQSGGVAVEVVTPYTEADLPSLQFAQSADVLNIIHGNYEPRNLIRLSHTSWSLQTVLFSNPPTHEADTDISGILPIATLSPASSTGLAVIFTASAPIFVAGDIGTYLWYPYLDGNDIRQEALAKIVGFTSTTVVTADIMQSFPNAIVSPNPAIPSQKWRHRKTTLIPGAVSGDNITFTASQSVFLAGDVTRYIKYGQSLAKIKTVTSGTVIVANIINDFPNTNAIPAGDWVLQGSPGVALDPVAIGAVGAIPDVREPIGRFNNMYARTDVSGTWTAIATYRDPDDVGKYIKVWGGVLKATQWIASDNMRCQVKSRLNAPTADPKSSGIGGWTLEVPSWNKTDKYPKTITYFGGRKFMGNSTGFPFRLWGSKSNDFDNFATGYLDDDGIQWDLLGGEVNTIQWLSLTNTLFVGCLGNEKRIEGGGKPLTPSNFQVKSDTEHGSLPIQPLRPQNGLIFVQRDSKKLRESTYDFDANVFEAKDLTLLSEHIVGSGVKEIAYQQEPLNQLWVVTKDGYIACMVYEKNEDVFGWSRRTTGKFSSNDTGFLANPIYTAYFENIAVIQHPSTSKDQVWVVVKRKINGSWQRYIEYFDDDGVYYNQLNSDCSLTWGYSLFYGDGATTAFTAGFDIQASGDVEVYVDGVLKTITTDYTIVIATDIITFTTAPSDRAKIQFFNKRKATVIYFGEPLLDSRTITGGEIHTLALKQDGTLWAWGWNGNGQLGDNTIIDRHIPTQVGTGTNWAKVVGGGTHTVALKKDGTLWAWGANAFGQLGDGTTTERHVPTQIGSGSNWNKVSAGDGHTIALKTDGTLWAWGRNQDGQLGDGTITDRLVPTQIGTDTNWIQVSAVGRHTVALKLDGTLWTWGYNFKGQLGHGDTTSRLVPTQVGTDTNWLQILFGGQINMHTVALKKDGTLWAWGANSSGQLGDGTTIDRLIPTQIGVATSWQQVLVGQAHTIALKTDGTLWAWGKNLNGQLGDGTTTDRLVPTQIGAGTDWRKIATGGTHSLALKLNSTLWAWGDNSNGEIGDNTTIQRNSPVQIDVNSWLLMFSHLEGETVDIVGDGSAQAQKVVTNGVITLDTAASKIEIGLPYTSILETLEPEIPNNTLFGRTRRWKELIIHLGKNSVGMKIGNAPPRSGKFTPILTEINFMEGWMDFDKPPKLFDRDITSYLTGWESRGRFLIMQDKPYPLTILGYTGRLEIGD